MNKASHLKGAYEKNYTLFCGMMQRGWSMEKIIKNLDMVESTVKSYKYLGRYKNDMYLANKTKIDTKRMMDLIHQLERKYHVGDYVDGREIKFGDRDIPEDDTQLIELRRVVGAI